MNFRLIFIAITLLSCSASRMKQTMLYFGQSKPDGSLVTEKEWNGFKENYISKVFKEGCSIVHVDGTWKDVATNKLITEPTYQVIYYYKKSAVISRQIDSLRYWYQTIFQQQSVLRVDNKVKTSF